jgi:hypothetical protein
MPDPHHVVVLLDPSSEAGARSLDYALEHLHPAATTITLFVSMSGVTAQSLRDFASSEDVLVPDAANAYLDQQRRRTASAGRELLVESTPGDDLAAEIADYGVRHTIGAVVVPARVARLDPAFVPRVATLMDIPVVVVPPARTPRPAATVADARAE